jgi:hypothetical protein
MTNFCRKYFFLVESEVGSWFLTMCFWYSHPDSDPFKKAPNPEHWAQEKQDGATRTDGSKQNQSKDDSKKGNTPPSEAETIENIQREVSRLKHAPQLEEKTSSKTGLKAAVFVSHLSDSETTVFPPDASRENGGDACTTDPARFEPSESIDLGKPSLDFSMLIFYQF